jgi:hypothetical protein
MARQPQTPEQIAARVAKSKATKLAKKKSALATLGVPVRTKSLKFRKKREMTQEQKEAAVARLAAAREARGPSQNTMVDEFVRNLPEDDLFSLKNVRQWIKTNRELLQAMKGMKESKESSERVAYMKTETYVANLEAYLRSGIYTDLAYGEHGQTKIKYVVRSNGMAYYPNGTPKRSVGVLYEDVGLYTEEMDTHDRGKAVSNKTKVREIN